LGAFSQHITNSLWFSGLAVDRLPNDLPHNRPIPKKSRRGVLKKESQIRFVNSEISRCSEGRVLKTHSPRHGANYYRRHYSVTPDGQRFLVNVRVDDHPPTILLQNWLSPAR
jgi:hypothetical protein